MAKAKVVNLTQHPILLLDENHDGMYVEIPPDGRTARVSSITRVEELVVVDGISIPVIRFDDREVRDLPDPEEGVLYLTSGLVAALTNRPDVVSPARVVYDPINRRPRGARALLRG